MADEPRPTRRKRRTTAVDPRVTPEILRALGIQHDGADAADPAVGRPVEPGHES